MGQNLFIVVDVAGDGVDVVAGLPLGKSGQWDTLEVVAHEEADVFADLRAADLGLGVAITVNQDTEQEDPCNHSGQHQSPVQVKLTRPQELHHRIEQHEEAAGEHALQHGPRNADIEIPILLQYLVAQATLFGSYGAIHLVLTHCPRPLPADR